jgi:hypothetical protein
MIDAQHLPQIAVSPLSSCLLAASLALVAPVALAAKAPIDDGIYRDAHEALGIGDDFGRWDDTIRLVYDPDGAPAAYASTAKVLTLVEEAYGYWTLISGVRFEMTGVNAFALDDRDFDNNPEQRDGLVRISWDNIGGAAGQAGPIGRYFDSDLGYYPYEDGTIELNKGVDVISSDFELIGVLVHEIGHLLGLGHSDNPDSVMYANPYNFLRYPRADDIRVMQVMYGAPAVALNPDVAVAAWVYPVPPTASASTTQFLFKPNSIAASGNGAYFDVDNTVVSSVTSATPNDHYVWLNVGLGGSSTALDVDATLIVVAPSGYVYDEREWNLSCKAMFACVQNITVGNTEVMKTIPGTWKIYVVNETTNQTLLALSLPVTTSVSFNRAPTASLTAVPGSTAAHAVFTLTATDPEGDNIEIVWRPPGLTGFATDVRNTVVSGGSRTLTVNFSQAGTHTFYVELRDDQPRYGDEEGSAAGEGFQTLLRVTATVPAATLQVASTQTTSGTAAQMLEAIAKIPASVVLSRNGANGADVPTTSVNFKLGASKDLGATTATSFKASDALIIAGSVSPQILDVGKPADIFIVALVSVPGGEAWYYLDSSGAFVPWLPLLSIAALQPAYRVSSLKTTEAFQVYSGTTFAATFSVFIGYRLSGGAALHYTGAPITLSVSN